MPQITVKKLILGAGQPKIAVPLVATNCQAVLRAARQAAAQPAVDLVEWRLDCLNRLDDVKTLVATARQLRTLIAPRPLLVTLRTAAEGGHFAGNSQAYRALYQALLTAECLDLIDLEITAHPKAVIRQLVQLAHCHGSKVIMSHHDFYQTPANADLFSCLRAMEQAGGDLAKIAVMPQNADDVLRLLAVTHRYHQEGQLPVITMAMGELGKISRISGELFGSCLTFASLSQASAPGQIDLAHLTVMLHELHLKKTGDDRRNGHHQ